VIAWPYALLTYLKVKILNIKNDKIVLKHQKCGSKNISVTRWRSNQVTAVRAIICTRDGAATTWSLFAMFQETGLSQGRPFATFFESHVNNHHAPLIIYQPRGQRVTRYFFVKQVNKSKQK
jgi:hypothetical protein